MNRPGDNHYYDVIIIGAGIIGCAIARELSYYNLRTAVFEKSAYVCSGQSKGNGAVIHGGHDAKSGTLKAKFNLLGNRMYPQWCQDLGVAFKQTGLLVVAVQPEKLPGLDLLCQRGRANGVKGLALMGRDQLLDMEPHVNPSAAGALFVPTAGLVQIQRLVIALAEHAAANGVQFFFEHEVEKIMVENNAAKGVTTARGNYDAGLVINCAGVDSEKMARSAGLGDKYKIVPRKAEYYLLDKKYKGLISRPCFPIPAKHGKGIAVFTTLNGNVGFGGNALEVQDRQDLSTTEEDFQDVYVKAQELVPGIAKKDLITGFGGIRSKSVTNDFIIDLTEQPSGIVNLNGIDSPGLSSAPAIAQYVIKLISRVVDLNKDCRKRKHYKIKPLFRDLDFKEKERWIKKDPRFGRIVCRCEEVTEGDIVGAIHAPIAPGTVDAIKFKTGAGTGRCQGSFDLERVLAIMSREYQIPMEAIQKKEQGSPMVTGKTKVYDRKA